MKRCAFCLIMIAIIASCKEAPENLLPSITGKVNQVLVVAEKNIWNSVVGDTIRAFFFQEQDGLPQSEPLMDLMNLPEMYFTKDMKGHRNVLQVSINRSLDSAKIQFADSPWARTQKYVRIDAPDVQSFMEIFEQNKLRILTIYSRAEQDRLVSIYKRTAENTIFNLFKNKYNLLFYCPTGYYVNKNGDDFAWISSETRKDSKGIVFYQEPYTHESQFNHIIAVDRFNEILMKHIPGPREGSYMAIDTEIPYTYTQFTYKGHYALKLRGLWTVVNDFMAGPMVMNIILDEKNNRLLYIMGYVYYPNENKRDMLKMVDAILNTLEIDFKEKEE